MRTQKPKDVTPAKWGGINIAEFRQAMPAELQPVFDRYLQLESQTAEELRATLWAEKQPADARENDAFDTRPIRERSLFRTADGRAIILDHVFYTEKASVGPLFALVKTLAERGDTQRINTVFGAFGTAFERYINELLRSMYPASPFLVDRLLCNPRANTSKGKDEEIADACLNDLGEVVLFESKPTTLVVQPS